MFGLNSLLGDRQMERNSMGEEEIGRDRVKDEATEVQRDREGGRETVRGRETYKKGEIWKERKRREGRRGGGKRYRRPTA